MKSKNQSNSLLSKGKSGTLICLEIAVKTILMASTLLIHSVSLQTVKNVSNTLVLTLQSGEVMYYQGRS